MSWPRWVVPSQCAADGWTNGGLVSATVSFWSANSCGIAATMQKTTNRPSPPIALGLRRSAVQNRPPRRLAAAGTATSAVGAWTSRPVISTSPLFPSARVEPCDGHVAGEHGHQHGDREEHEQHLHE